MPSALVLRTVGTNCDRELVRAFEVSGASVDLVHLHALMREPDRLDAYDIIAFPGGFSYGDDVASGRLFAMRTRLHLLGALRRAAGRGCPIIGVCNGFQVLVQVGLLPGPAAGWGDVGGGVEGGGELTQEVSLTSNTSGTFVDRWVGVSVDASSSCIWTGGLESCEGDGMLLPVAHAEGRFVAPDAVLDRLERNGQVALRYAEDINGSDRAIAGICDPSGRVFGLMPHPERFLEWFHHPFWTRLDPESRRGDTIGIRMFRNAVQTAACLPA